MQNITSRDLNTALSEIFRNLESKPVVVLTAEDIIDNIIEKLQLLRFQSNSKIGFLIDQLVLLFKAPNWRRYSSSLLAMTVLLQKISPACYKQMHRDGFLTLPSLDHLRRLCSAINMATLSLNDSTIAYLTARYVKLQDLEKLMSVLMDEVYSYQSVQYVNGKFYGDEDGQITKTLLCVNDKSHYRKIPGYCCDGANC